VHMPSTGHPSPFLLGTSYYYFVDLETERVRREITHRHERERVLLSTAGL